MHINEARGYDRHIGSTIKNRRIELGWSQEDLRDKLHPLGLDLHQTNIAKMESGKRPIKVSEAAVVASALHWTLSELLARSNPLTGSNLEELDAVVASHEEALRRTATGLADAVAARALITQMGR